MVPRHPEPSAAHSPSMSPHASRPHPPVKVRLMAGAEQRPARIYKSKGHKRTRGEGSPSSATASSSTESARPIIKLKFRNPNRKASPVPEPAPPRENIFFKEPLFPTRPSVSTSEASTSRVEITPRPVTPVIGEPVAKRPRSYSNSSIVGLLVSDDDKSPSTSVAASPATTINHSSPPPTATKISFHSSHVPSPLASAPLMGFDFDDVSRSIRTSSPTPMSDVEMSSTLTPGPLNVEGNPMSQLAKARSKFLAEVEALGAEMNNVFKLGYGRGMGRATAGGTRGPSRLRAGVSKKVSDDEEESMELDLW
ncbi:hypothetical protein CI109_106582 [Kwoniella shandongensis]|uniref:Uncharacterized protein n=1 Tax=Kwoniella shandongensis TaxID=1734106 RepID=A0AAJ8LMI3_9TREE